MMTPSTPQKCSDLYRTYKGILRRNKEGKVHLWNGIKMVHFLYLCYPSAVWIYPMRCKSRGVEIFAATEESQSLSKAYLLM
jgi:hypothetical protein